MRRALVILVLAGLVLVSFGIAVLAADWPFWQRAWRWHAAGVLGPDSVPGSWGRIGRGKGGAWLPVDPDGDVSEAIEAIARQTGARALLVVRDGRLLAEHYGRGTDPATLLQGDTLTALVLAPLYGVAREVGGDLLDLPLRQLVPELGQDPRGDILPRQLLWQVSGLESPPFHPLNPFSARARVASGPNYARAALDFREVWPAGSHFDASPANAQLLALALTSARGAPLIQLLETGLWQPLGAGEAQVALDRLGGDMAAHCCLAATARDWLRLARLLAEDGTAGSVRLLPEGFVAEMARSTAVHPGYGLGMEIETDPAGETLMWGVAPGRLLLAVPSRRLAAVWFGQEDASQAVRVQLRSALDLDAQPSSDAGLR